MASKSWKHFFSLPQSYFLWTADFHMELEVYTTEGTKPRTINSIQIKMITDILFLLSEIQNFHSQQHFTMLEAVMKTFRKAPNSVKFKTVLRFLAVRYTKCAQKKKQYVFMLIVCGLRGNKMFVASIRCVFDENSIWKQTPLTVAISTTPKTVHFLFNSFHFICISRSASVSLFVCHL